MLDPLGASFESLSDGYDSLGNGTPSMIDEYAVEANRHVRLLNTRVGKSGSEGKEYLATLKQILHNAEEPEKRRATAFYVLAVHLRHQKRFVDWEELLRDGSRLLPQSPLVPFQYAVYYKTVNPTEERLRLAQEKWGAIDDRIIESPAFGQAYADTIATRYFRGAGRIPDTEEDRTQFERALSIANRAALLRPGSKTLTTHAKLLALNGEFDRASAMVYDAVEFEDMSRQDYALRIVEFESILNRIETMASLWEQMSHIEAAKTFTLEQFASELDLKSADLNSRLEKSRIDLLTFMSLFAGVLALLITGGSLAQSSSFKTGAGLLVVLGAVLIVVFSVFLLMIDFSRERLTTAGGSIFVALIMIAIAVGIN